LLAYEAHTLKEQNGSYTKKQNGESQAQTKIMTCGSEGYSVSQFMVQRTSVDSALLAVRQA